MSELNFIAIHPLVVETVHSNHCCQSHGNTSEEAMGSLSVIMTHHLKLDGMSKLSTVTDIR